MSLNLITAASADPVSLDEAKAHLRVDGAAEDLLIGSLIKSVTGYIDGKYGFLARSLMTQTWELRIDAFEREIKLPLPPLQSVASIKYTDVNGAEQTIDPSVYRVLTGDKSTVLLAFNQCWPAPRQEAEAVRIRFVSGYGTAADVPAPIKAALLLHIGTLYRDREATGQAQVELPMAYGSLLAPYRIWGF